MGLLFLSHATCRYILALHKPGVAPASPKSAPRPWIVLVEPPSLEASRVSTEVNQRLALCSSPLPLPLLVWC